MSPYKHVVFCLSAGGDERDRTDDPLLAKQVLSQLSYTPIWVSVHYFSTFEAEPQKLNNDSTGTLSDLGCLSYCYDCSP